MKVGFTGTRDGMTDDQRKAFKGMMSEKMTAFHHGSCKGADVFAAQTVYLMFEELVRIVCHPGPVDDPCQEDSGVDDEVRLPKNHFARNRDIVDETDELIACPREMEHQDRGGTWYTIDYAKKRNKTVTIIYPNGTVETFYGLA